METFAKTQARSSAKLLEEEIRRHILAGTLQGNAMIPSESKLMQKYPYSRYGIRQALEHLRREGLIYKVRGSGTYVTSEKDRPVVHASSTAESVRSRQIVFLSFSSIFSEQTFIQTKLGGPFFDSISKVCEKQGYNVLCSHVGLDFTPPPCLINHDAAGILFHGLVPQEFWDRYMSLYPCVGMHLRNPELDCSWVMLDDDYRSFLAVSHLYQLGHRRIGYISDEAEEPITRKRFRGFRDALEHFGLESRNEWNGLWQRSRVNGELLCENTHRMPDYREHLAPAFAGAEPPTAFVCLDNWRAYCTMEALKKMHLRVPQDISLVGGCNHKNSHYIDESFTRVYDQVDQIWLEAALLLLEQLNTSRTISPRTVLIRPELLIGETTARLHK